MTISRTVARWMMEAVVRHSPPARHEWAVAMQREYDALDRGHLAWAAGCFTAAARWALRREWLYLLLICLVPVIIEVVPRIEFDFLWYGLVSRSAFIAFEHNYAAVIGILTPLPLAILLGRYRPDRVGTTIILGCLLAQHVGGTLMVMRELGGSFLSWWAPNATLYMMPPLAGLLTSMCVWYIGASLGARMRWPVHR
ncbi:MAG: hypothetical protein JWO81_3392 [Alphaproteobacteria bacterium]|nr:hypothetical protein [Alphaproteobacteria bacterium]